MYTQNEVVEIVTKFRDLIKTIQEDARVNESIIQESDKAWGDIRHYCEFKNTARRPKKTQLFRLIGSYGRQRRQAKNFLQVAQPLLDFMDKQPNFVKNIGTVANEMNKALKFVEGEHKYVPRVLTDLFEEE